MDPCLVDVFFVDDFVGGGIAERDGDYCLTEGYVVWMKGSLSFRIEVLDFVYTWQSQTERHQG